MSSRMKRLLGLAALAIAAALVAIHCTPSPVHAATGAAPGRIHSGRQAMIQAAQPAAAPASDSVGAASYTKHCAICHGDNREGILPAFPPLVGIKRQLTDQQITALIHVGKGRMPGLPGVQNEELAGLLRFLASTPEITPSLTAGAAGGNRRGPQLTGEAAAGGALFLQNCAFCHGRDAMGGETGPDLTQSKLVLEDADGSKIMGVVREGRIEKKMPAFQFSSPELVSLVAFIRARVTAAASMKGNRRGVDVSDLQTGNAEAGKKYFNGAGGCANCHSPTGDLAGVARRYEGLRLEERMLYPRDAKSSVLVTLPSGQKVEGTLAYLDEFTVGLRDHDGNYKSWAIENVKYAVNSPVDAHVEQFPKYTDDDIHNLMAYLQTLK
jgi:mono/diheme cytochrome c family protein